MPKNSSKSKKPLISFIIRTKNEEELIGKVLKSLYAQTYKNFEIIVVDSGSTDKTLEIVKKFPIKLLQIKPKEYNPSYALNLGITKTKGKYIGIISGHSLPISRTWFKDGFSNFRNQKIAAVTGHYTEKTTGYHCQTLGWILFKLKQKSREEFCPWMTNTNAIIRKDLWKKYPFDEKLSEGCEDYDWGCEMIVRGYNVIKDPKFSVFHFHYCLDRPGARESQPRWKRICAMINKRKRPRKSFTRLKIY